MESPHPGDRVGVLLRGDVGGERGRSPRRRRRRKAGGAWLLPAEPEGAALRAGGLHSAGIKKNPPDKAARGKEWCMDQSVMGVKTLSLLVSATISVR